MIGGDRQEYEVNFTETFSPTAKPESWKTMLSVGASKGWIIHQMDVKSAYLNAPLEEDIYCYQPEGYCKVSSLQSHVVR